MATWNSSPYPPPRGANFAIVVPVGDYCCRLTSSPPPRLKPGQGPHAPRATLRGAATATGPSWLTPSLCPNTTASTHVSAWNRRTTTRRPGWLTGDGLASWVRVIGTAASAAEDARSAGQTSWNEAQQQEHQTPRCRVVTVPAPARHWSGGGAHSDTGDRRPGCERRSQVTWPPVTRHMGTYACWTMGGLHPLILQRGWAELGGLVGPSPGIHIPPGTGTVGTYAHRTATCKRTVSDTTSAHGRPHVRCKPPNASIQRAAAAQKILAMDGRGWMDG